MQSPLFSSSAAGGSISGTVQHHVCRVCGHDAAMPTYRLREMMYGTLEPFDYFRCNRCACLQISEIPADLAPYYRSDYYSIKTDHAAKYKGRVKNLVNRTRDRISLLMPGGERFPWGVKVPHLATAFTALRNARRLRLDSRIIDIGCGSGELLFRLHNAGFTRLTGADPFLDSERNLGPGFKIVKRTLEQVDGEFDILLMNHSFEHVTDPRRVLEQVAARLAPGGIAIIRIPLSDCAAWDEYGEYWFQLDAPRHLYLHTQASMAYLAEQAGLRIERTVHDSGPEQFVISERYRLGLPMVIDRNKPPPSIRYEVTDEQMQDYANRAAALNAAGRGDQASFYLTRP